MGENFIGEIRLFAFGLAQEGWIKCDGTIYPIQNYEPLYALIGNIYGGVPEQSFAVPDLRGAEPHPNINYSIAVTGYWPERP